MKRALAERAKQSGLPNGVVSSSVLQVPPSEPPSVPLSSGDISPSQPLKVPRIDNNGRGVSSSSMRSMPSPSSKSLSISVPNGNINRSTSLGSALSPRSARGTKRPRGSDAPSPRRRMSLPEETEDDDDSNQAKAFYLKHQNRALASELSAAKYQLSRLARERDHRRAQCVHACQSLHSLQATWTQMEAALQVGPDPNDMAASSPDLRGKNNRAPLSTGEGKSVELVGALLESLAALGDRKTKTKSKKNSKDIKREHKAKKKKAAKKKNGSGSSNNYAIVDSDDDDESSDEENLSNESKESSDADSDSDSESDDWGAESKGPSADSPMGDADQAQLDDLLRITDNVSRRATTLQQWIWGLLRRIEAQSSPSSSAQPPNSAATIAKLTNRLSKEKAKTKTLKATLHEVSRARDEMTLSDRRVRRGLYRLAAGRAQLNEVMKDIELADEDKAAALAWMDGEPAYGPNVIKNEAVNGVALPGVEAAEAGGTVDSAQVVGLQKKLLEIEQVSASRDKQIQQLLEDCESKDRRINDLLLEKQEEAGKTNCEQSDAAEQEKKVRQSDLFADLTTKLAVKTSELERVEAKMAEMRVEWSQALGDAELARSTIQDMQSKHAKKWAELTSNVEVETDENGKDSTASDAEMDSDYCANGDDENEKPSLLPSSKNQAAQIITLRHKLTQALENVRQAEATRRTLAESQVMMESLQAKYDEVRAKYAALQQSRQAHGGQNPGGVAESPGASTPKSKGYSSSEKPSTPISGDIKGSDRSEKLHRDYRRARKELAALSASKEAAKAKLERLEKERESLVQTNMRLLKQTAEKDDMNAQSLSTILHLKQVTEQGAKERDSLEQQVKSAQQLALSARLTANARERLDEEFLKRQKELEQLRDSWEQKCVSLSAEKNSIDSKLTQQRNKMSTVLKDAEVAQSRCNELTSELTELKRERHKMMESLAVAQKEAADAVRRSKQVAKSSGVGGSSQFTAEELSTQVTVLQGRLMCPVCNCRDKNCILSRCNHMFCKECVDENVKNRSRKCPACGQRFDTKDIGEVWL